VVQKFVKSFEKDKIFWKILVIKTHESWKRHSITVDTPGGVVFSYQIIIKSMTHRKTWESRKVALRTFPEKEQSFPGKVAGYAGFFHERFSSFFAGRTLHTTLNDQHDKEGGGRTRNATENAAANNNKQGPQSPAVEPLYFFSRLHTHMYFLMRAVVGGSVQIHQQKEKNCLLLRTLFITANVLFIMSLLINSEVRRKNSIPPDILNDSSYLLYCCFLSPGLLDSEATTPRARSSHDTSHFHTHAWHVMSRKTDMSRFCHFWSRNHPLCF